MRAIDADKLMKKAVELYLPPEDPEETWCFGRDVVVIPVDDVEQAPTITYEDLVPHGRWLGKEPVPCSECIYSDMGEHEFCIKSIVHEKWNGYRWDKEEHELESCGYGKRKEK